MRNPSRIVANGFRSSSSRVRRSDLRTQSRHPLRKAAMSQALPLPWLDRAGRLSMLKLVAFLLAVAPAFYLAGAYAMNALGPKPITALIHGTGEWTIRFLLASLVVTPLRRVANWPRLINIRRLLGVTTMAYALAHLCLYVVDQNFDLAKVASEIALRFYLTIGFAALLGLIALGATSTDAAIRRMGSHWVRLHKAVYAIGALGLLHYFLQSKIDVSDPVFWTGLFVLLMGWRLMQKFRLPMRPWSLALLAVAAGLSTAGIEAAWYGIKSGIPAELVLGANLDFSDVIRPAWWVFAAGMLLPVIALARMPAAARRPPAAGAARPARAVPAE